MLTVQQPWAWAIAAGAKRVENRSRSTSYRGWVAVHAGKRTDPAGARFIAGLGLMVPADLVYGAILAVVELTGCVSDSRDVWAMPGMWHWQLGDIVPLTDPIPCRGQLGLFRAPAAVANQLADTTRQFA